MNTMQRITRVNEKRCLFVDMRKLLFLGLLIVCGMFIADTAFAADEGFVSRIVTSFANESSKWASRLQEYARRLFALLLIVDVVLLGAKAALDSSAIKDTLKTFVMTLLFAGFMLAVINNYPEWSRNIVNGLGMVGTELGGIDPSDSPFLVGLRIIDKLFGDMSIWSPIDSLGLLIAGCIIIICFALMAAYVVLLKCEAFIAMNAGIILLGLGGSAITKEYSINFMRYGFSVAFKLFVMQLLLSVGMTFLMEFETDSASTFTEILTLIGASIVLLALVKSIPDVVGGIINGSHVTSGSAMTAAGAAVGGAMIGAGMAVASGGKNLSSASKQADMAGQTGVGKMAHMAQNLWSARQEAKQGGRPTTSTIMQERLNSARMSGKS